MNSLKLSVMLFMAGGAIINNFLIQFNSIMKNLFIIAAMFSAMLVSCNDAATIEFIDEVENQTSANSGTFDEKDYYQRPIDEKLFEKTCCRLIDQHKEFDYFRVLLSGSMNEKIDTNSYTVDDAVKIIFIWWSNDETFDVLVESCWWEDFIPNLPEKYFIQYPFHW